MGFAFFRKSARGAKAGTALVRYKGQLGVWYIGYRDAHGKRVQQRTRASTQSEAEKIVGELERKAERVRLGIEAFVGADMTYRDAVADHLASLPPEFKSKAMLEGRFNNRILPHMGDLMCRAITPADVLKMLAANTDCSPQTREHLRVAVQGSFRFLIESKKLVIGQNPGAAVDKVAIPKRIPRFLEEHAIPRLLAAVPPQHLVLFVWSVGTGARKGESLALKWDKVDLERGLAILAASNDSDTTKGGKDRVVYLPSWLTPFMREHAKSVRSAWVFPDSTGGQQKKWVKLHLVMRTALCAAGLVQGFDHTCVTRGQFKGCGHIERRQDDVRVPCQKCGRKQMWPKAVPIAISFKDLRSTFATWALQRTGNIKFVQKALGHGDAKVTERYAHLLEASARAHTEQVSFGLPDSISSLQAGSSQSKRNKAKPSHHPLSEKPLETSECEPILNEMK